MIYAPLSRRIVAVAVLVVGLGACAPRMGPLPDAERKKPSGSDPVAVAAEQSVRDYVAGLARVARETAAAAPTFKTHADATTYGAEKNKIARDEAFQPAFQLINERLLATDPATGKKRPYDPAATAAAFQSFAEGCERALSRGN